VMKYRWLVPQASQNAEIFHPAQPCSSWAFLHISTHGSLSQVHCSLLRKYVANRSWSITYHLAILDSFLKNIKGMFGRRTDHADLHTSREYQSAKNDASHTKFTLV
jgi:hypothetical protein